MTTVRPVPARQAPRVAATPSRVRHWIDRLGRLTSSLRARNVAWFVGALALATIGLVVVTYEVVQFRIDQRIDLELRQEAAELRALVDEGEDPQTGRPFAGVRRIFDVYLENNDPSQNEVFVTFLAGEPYRSALVVPYRLDQDPELVARWANLTEPDRGGVGTPAGRVEYLAVPLTAPGGKTGGVFVGAIFRDRAAATETESAILASGAVGLGVLLLGSLLAWRLADRVVRPVTELTRTAKMISETDLSARIPADGRDEVAQLAQTFNDTLDRLERALGSQRRFVDEASGALKTSLAIVRGHLELLDDADAAPETLALLTAELDRMGRIVQDLALLARLEEPEGLSLAVVDVGALTDAFLAKARALSPRDWVLDVRGQGVIVADRQRLTQAMMQLAETAARYGNPSNPIAVGSIVSGGQARFWIRGDGPGIPTLEREAVFERFRREPGAGRSNGGAGLGLAIVRAIAEAHKGSVELESSRDGWVFSIVVPVDQPEARLAQA